MSRMINKNMSISSMVSKWVKDVVKVKTRKGIVATILVIENAVAAKCLPVSYRRTTSDSSVKTRYNKHGVSNKLLSVAVDTLTDMGYLESSVGTWGWEVEDNTSSVFMATQLLLELFPKSEIEYIHKTYKDTVENVLLKSEDKELVDYLDTTKTVRMSGVLSSINLINSLYSYTHNSGTLSNDGLVRIFNNGSFEKGGRFYRSDIQQIKQRDEKGNNLNIKDTRLGLLIDGEPVVECDYGSLHPFLICALHNMDASRFNGDIYSEMLPENYVEADRQLFKLALLFMFNSTTRDKALKAVQQEINFNKGVYSFHYSTSVVSRIEQELPEFSDFFYRDDSYGLTLQNIDSKIMEDIMKQFIAKKYPLCPVHDSIVVRAQDEGFAVEAMCKSFRKIVGQEAPCFSIKVKRWDGSQSMFKFGA